MLFEILPSCVYASKSMTDYLSIELCAMILRYMDPESLLNAAFVNRSWMIVCKGYLVLRNRIRMQIKETYMLQIEIAMNPSRTVEVVRNKRGKIYNRNMEKKVMKRKLPVLFVASENMLEYSGEPKRNKSKQMVSKLYKNIRL